MKRTFIIAGQTIGLEVLGQPIDESFEKLHAAHLSGSLLSWDDFTRTADIFFSANIGSPGPQDAFFNNFTVIWRHHLDAGRFHHAEHIWQQALQPALNWERANPTQRIHKGTPYYFWGVTAILRGDLDRGYLLIHKAVDEDVRTSGQPTPNTPGIALVSINYQKVDQAFRQWVLEQAQFLDDLITNYTTTHHRALTLADVKRRFLDSPPNTDTLFLLTYTLARLMKLATIPPHATDNPFAGQLELNLLFDITLVIDAAIKAKNTDHRQFINQAKHLLDTARETLTIDQLGDINRQFNANFDTTLQAAIDNTLVITDLPAIKLTKLQCDVALAYGLRNHGAHNTGSATTVWNRFADVQQALFRVLFATIEHLY